MANTKLTPEQANDCARYFLGREWSAALNERTGAHCLFQMRGIVHTHVNSNWPDVFRSVGVDLPNKGKERIVAIGKDVKRGGDTIARAVSPTLAKRIASALNAYAADRRGQ